MIWLADDGSWGSGRVMFIDPALADTEVQRLYQEMLDGADGTELYALLTERSK